MHLDLLESVGIYTSEEAIRISDVVDSLALGERWARGAVLGTGAELDGRQSHVRWHRRQQFKQHLAVVLKVKRGRIRPVGNTVAQGSTACTGSRCA